MEIIGWIGTGLVVVAYYPQIRHLWAEKCAWGISIMTWVIWLVASIFLLAYALMGGSFLFVFVQTINLVVERNTPVTFFEPLPIEPAPAESAAANARAATPAARATPAATPLPAKIKSTPTPAARKSGEGVKKKPFRLNN